MIENKVLEKLGKYKKRISRKKFKKNHFRPFKTKTFNKKIQPIIKKEKTKIFRYLNGKKITIVKRFWKKNFGKKIERYSTLGGKTGKLDEAVNRELNWTRSWNFIQIVDLVWFILRMIFKLICIFYDFKAPLLENH